MKQYFYILVATFFLTAQPAFAGKAISHSIQASGHASKAVGHSVAGASKLTSGVVAVPLVVVGEIGKAVGATGEIMWDSANTPLPISEEAVTAGPPPSVPSEKKEFADGVTRKKI